MIIPTCAKHNTSSVIEGKSFKGINNTIYDVECQFNKTSNYIW